MKENNLLVMHYYERIPRKLKTIFEFYYLGLMAHEAFKGISLKVRVFWDNPNK